MAVQSRQLIEEQSRDSCVGFSCVGDLEDHVPAHFPHLVLPVLKGRYGAAIQDRVGGTI